MKKVRSIVRILLGLLRELSDEGPYQRYLAAHGNLHSPKEWRKFSEQRQTARYARPGCC